jgi:4-hydroxy-3-methylbut-2-enyl diphosphate reductase
VTLVTFGPAAPFGYPDEIVSQTYFQKGFGLKAAVGPVLARSYHSAVVERLRELDHAARAGDLVLKLAREFGFCYGVDRAVEYAYETREKFPDRRVFLSGEIIHNPDVNGRIEAMGIQILPERSGPAERYAEVRGEDVVILPAFGVPVAEMEHLRGKGCVLVDTTCGSVMNVWKNVHNYAREGFTAVIHGKHYHEETKATASQALTHEGGQYLCVRDREEAAVVCDFIRGYVTCRDLLARFAHAVGPGFDPVRDLGRIGVANQTTMLMSESLEIQGMLRDAMAQRYGEEEMPRRFRAMDTICSATQDRQDAVLKMLHEGGPDVMIVIGGYNSSNTQALARICAERLPTFHIRDARGIEATGAIRHRPAGVHGGEVLAPSWLPEGPTTVGLTAGASTPNNVVGEVVERILALRGRVVADLERA